MPDGKSTSRKEMSSAIEAAGIRPADDSAQATKKNYSEKISNEAAKYLARRLRDLGLDECQPDEAGGRERQFAGGIGAKKVDVSFATETGGLILGISVKSICFPDPRTGNYAKNLTNRRGDLLAEATTLHQRFPYAVLGGLFLFDDGAEKDGTDRRSSTIKRAHDIFRMFGNREDRINSVEKYETLAIASFSASPPQGCRCRLADSDASIAIDDFLRLLLVKVAERNPDHYYYTGEKIEKIK